MLDALRDEAIRLITLVIEQYTADDNLDLSGLLKICWERADAAAKKAEEMEAAQARFMKKEAEEAEKEAKRVAQYARRADKQVEDERRRAEKQAAAAEAALEKRAASVIAAAAAVAKAEAKAAARASDEGKRQEQKQAAAVAKAVEEERRRAEEAERKAEKRSAAEAIAAAKAAEEERRQLERLSTADAKAEAVEAIRRRATAAAAEQAGNRHSSSHAGSITSQRLERAQSRGSLLRRSSRVAQDESEEGVISHALMSTKTSAAADALKKPLSEQETPTAPPRSFRLQEPTQDPTYLHPVAAPWLQQWRSGGVRSAELDALTGFVADCLAAEDDTIVAADGLNVSIYSASDEVVMQHLEGHTDQVCSVAIQGDLIASGSRDNTIRLWSASTGACTGVLQGCEELICGLALNGDHLLSGEGRSAAKVRMWSVSEAQQKAIFAEHTGPVWSIAIGAEVVVSASQDKKTLIWPRTATGPTGSIGSLAHPDWVFSVSVEGDLAATGCRDGHVRLWSLATFYITRTISTLSTGSSPVYSVRLARGVLVTGTEDKLVHIWSLGGAGECICTLHHAGAVRGVAVSPTGSFIASAGGKRLALWRTPSAAS